MSHASMEEEEWRLKHYYHDVKSFPLHIKPKNILALSRGPIKLPPFQKIPLHANLCWG